MRTAPTDCAHNVENIPLSCVLTPNKTACNWLLRLKLSKAYNYRSSQLNRTPSAHSCMCGSKDCPSNSEVMIDCASEGNTNQRREWLRTCRFLHVELDSA
jgi:hypothetical protein